MRTSWTTSRLRGELIEALKLSISTRTLLTFSSRLITHFATFARVAHKIRKFFIFCRTLLLNLFILWTFFIILFETFSRDFIISSVHSSQRFFSVSHDGFSSDEGAHWIELRNFQHFTFLILHLIAHLTLSQPWLMMKLWMRMMMRKNEERLELVVNSCWSDSKPARRVFIQWNIDCSKFPNKYHNTAPSQWWRRGKSSFSRGTANNIRKKS